jgi:hypothetical protein
LSKPRRSFNRSDYSNQSRSIRNIDSSSLTRRSSFNSSLRSQSQPPFRLQQQQQQQQQHTQSQPPKGDDLWIRNAAYFLNNCDIYLLNVLSPQKICFRLLTNDFHGQYKIMLDRLNFYYKNNNSKIKQVKVLSKDKACVAYISQSEKYLRCVIIEIQSSSVIRVNFADEGFEGNVQAFDLYELENEFRQLNFQVKSFVLVSSKLLCISLLKR